MSRFGHWRDEHGQPAFVYDADQSALPEAEWEPVRGRPTTRHWVGVGNRRITLVAANDGGCGLWDEAYGLRWLTAQDTGVTVILESDARWGTCFADRPAGAVPERVFGPTWFGVRCERDGVTLERTVLCPEGEAPWVLVRLRLGGAARRVRVVEEWTLRPRFVSLGATSGSRRADGERAVRYRIERSARGLRATEERTPEAIELEGATPFAHVFGPPLPIVLESLGRQLEASVDGDPFPTLRLAADVGVPAELWFRFGIDDGSVVDDPASLFDRSLDALRKRLPRAAAPRAPQASREIPWHAALLTGGACRDEVIGGHTLDQASAYSYVMGFNGAARDPLQHALPLVYSEPDLALSVLRNTCAWATPDGDLPYALDGAKRPWTSEWQPSDQNLWALWLAAEYAAATGDLRAFDEPLAYHPLYGAEAVPLREHLRRQLRFFVDGVGRGANGHVRMRNADWNDMAVAYSGVPREQMTRDGESVLNSAMAAWTLPVYAGLCERLGDAAQAGEARAYAASLRDAVAGEWNGRWFRRAYAPERGALGDDDLWLETQPWAILCGAASGDRARELLATIDEVARRGSPTGARVRVPPGEDLPGLADRHAEATNGGTWYSINMTLVWAAARVDAELAWDEWRRMTLAAHTDAYPHVWEGTLSGPDSYNAPESPRPGRTWGWLRPGMQSWPVNNLHSHAQPLLSYMRLLGVEPLDDGALRVGASGASFASRTFEVRAGGSGRLTALGPVVLRTPRGTVEAGPGEVAWG